MTSGRNRKTNVSGLAGYPRAGHDRPIRDLPKIRPDGSFRCRQPVRANDGERVMSALRASTSDRLATDSSPPLDRRPRKGARSNVMGKEKSPTIRGGHWGGSPPERTLNYRFPPPAIVWSCVITLATATARGYL